MRDSRSYSVQEKQCKQKSCEEGAHLWASVKKTAGARSHETTQRFRLESGKKYIIEIHSSFTAFFWSWAEKHHLYDQIFEAHTTSKWKALWATGFATKLSWTSNSPQKTFSISRRNVFESPNYEWALLHSTWYEAEILHSYNCAAAVRFAQMKANESIKEDYAC